MEKFQRTIQLIGNEAFKKLQQTTVIVVGVGGVGSFAVESLVRSGVGSIVLIDKDTYEITNINRQWPANINSIGKRKVEVVAEECLKISPAINIFTEYICLNADNIDEVFSKHLKSEVVVIDAIDDLKAKVILLHYLKEHNIKFISSMGAANLIEIESIKYGLLDKTAYCPVAKIIRKELGLLGASKDITVVYSTEERLPGSSDKGSVMPITATFGLKLAMWVITEI
ncbi:MAG: ThiF family adenylyltransferase [Candidatus Margulisbacteria bacterium]|nr:ThiF family adenylyltransferase [Candidatus Margulisiibacteriota bacterium]